MDPRAIIDPGTPAGMKLAALTTPPGLIAPSAFATKPARSANVAARSVKCRYCIVINHTHRSRENQPAPSLGGAQQFGQRRRVARRLLANVVAADVRGGLAVDQSTPRKQGVFRFL